jgi:general secretion pathway protein D
VSSKDKTELILAITPRLVRGVTVPQNGLMSFSSGKEDDPSLVRPLIPIEQEPATSATKQPKSSEKKPVVPTTPAVPVTIITPALPVVSAAPAALSTTATPETSPPIVAIPLPPSSPPAVTEATPILAPVQRGLLQIGAPQSVTVGQQFIVDIKVNGVTDLINSPFVLTFDPAFVDFMSVTEGPFMKKDGKSTTFSSKTETAGGTVSVSLARAAEGGGVSGGGSLVTAMFRAKNQGSAGFAFRSVGLSGVNGAPLTILPFSTRVDIR